MFRPEIKEILLAGTAEERGEGHGSGVPDLIASLAEVRLELLSRLYGLLGTSVVQSIAEGMLAEIEVYAPEVFIETRATAGSAGIPHWKLLIAGAFSDISDLLAREVSRTPPAHAECTLISMPTHQGVVILGTWDTHASGVGGLILCRRRPPDSPETLALTTAGWPMQQGLSSAGFAYAVANLVADRAYMGLPYIAVLPEACKAATMNAAINRISQLHHASARYYLFCSGSEGKGIEVVPPKRLLTSTARSAWHTNHFTHREAVKFEGRPRLVDESRSRLRMAVEFLRGMPSIASPEELLRDFLVSGTLQEGEGDEDRTGVVFVIQPRTGDLYYAIPGDGWMEGQVIHRSLDLN